MAKKTRWWRMDLHIHTPASADYEQPEVTYLDILQRAAERGVDILAFTDHNTVAGYRAMQEEIKQLELLEELGRLNEKEAERLETYRRLLDRVLVLPGFEFTATLGFHILGIFPPTMPVRAIEHLLLELKVPLDRLDEGATEVGATADVLTAYRVIDEAGGIVIAAHANTNHGVAMRGLGFGGQTRIAYTQDPHLHALEVTDLEKRGRYTTARFFDGSKPEYPRPMRCIQGSDAHRLTADPRRRERLGVGDRQTEIRLPERTFEALRQVLVGNDFTLTRPARPLSHPPFDHVRAAREEGPSIVQSFHEGATRRGGRLYAILADIVAFANTNGGTIYVGVSGNPKVPPVGVEDPAAVIQSLRQEVDRRVVPPLDVSIDTLESEGKTILRIRVPRGDDPPYAIDGSKIYIRDEAETNLAVRDEIVAMVKRSLQQEQEAAAAPEPVPEPEVEEAEEISPPRTGVEIVETTTRKGIRYHTMRDLRRGNTVKNVTRSSARRLWHYAITQKEEHPISEDQITWRGSLGFIRRYKRSGRPRYDLAQRMPDGTIRIYYGVSEEGLTEPWRIFLEELGYSSS